MSYCVIKAEHLSKMYQLGVINNGTLLRDFQTWLALKQGKEDPNSPIGKNRYLGNEDHFWALKDIGFEINQGDRVGIIGKNGAGKSTLLKILSRITSPTEGVIKIKGKIASLLEVGTGFHGELTGRENIYLNGAILGMKKRQIDRKLDEIIAFSEIDHHIDTPVKRYSSGMYVRLAFAVAAHLDSDILIADEVLAVGDASFQKKALGKMNELSYGEGRTILFVSHNMSAVKSLCTSGILLQEGRIAYTGTLETTIQEYLGKQKVFGTKWVKDSSTKKLKYLDILEMELVDSQDLVIESIINSNDKLKLKIKLRVITFDKDLTLGFTLFNSQHESVYRSLSTDIDLALIEYFKTRGEIDLSCVIPINFLKEGNYYIKLDSSIYGREWIINPDENTDFVLGFSLENHSFGNKMLTSSLIAPIVHWEVNHA